MFEDMPEADLIDPTDVGRKDEEEEEDELAGQLTISKVSENVCCVLPYPFCVKCKVCESSAFHFISKGILGVSLLDFQYLCVSFHWLKLSSFL